MASWQEAAKERKGDTILNATFDEAGMIKRWHGTIVFHQSWPGPGKAQIVTTKMSELVDVEKIDENLPENLKNDSWQ